MRGAKRFEPWRDGKVKREWVVVALIARDRVKPACEALAFLSGRRR